MTNSEIDDHYRRVKQQSEKVQDDMLFDQLVRDCKQGELSDEARPAHIKRIDLLGLVRGSHRSNRRFAFCLGGFLSGDGA